MLAVKKPPTLEDAQAKHIHFELLIGFAILVIALFLPYVSYSYNSASYTLSGLSILTGKTVLGGKVVLPVSIPMIVLVIAALAILLSAFMDYIRNANTAYGVSTLAGIAIVVVQILFANSIGDKLSSAKKVFVSFGSLITLAVAFALVIWGMYRLWRTKVLSALDFMAIPGMLYFIINNYIPMFGIVIAFKKVDYSKGIWASPWAGLDNFKQLFATNTTFFASDAWRITRNTLLYNLVFIILGNIVGIVLGICLAEIFSKFWQKFFQTSILLPQLISYVIVAYIVYGFFSSEAGFVNHLLGTNINFYVEEKYWPFVLVFIQAWKQAGYNAIIYLSSIVGIDRTIYEAARLDGCTKWQQIRRITLPMLKPTVITLTMLNIGRIMYSDFGLFYQVTRNSGALYNVADTVDTYVYRMLMTMNNISTASAASTYQAIIGFILVLVVNMIVRRKDKENALF